MSASVDNPISWEPSRVLLQYAIAANLIGALIFLLVVRSVTTDQPIRLVGPVLITLIAVSAWFLLSRGAMRAAVNVMASGIWLVATVMAAFFGGVRAPVIIVYPLMVCMFGWLVSQRAALAVSALSIAVTIGFVVSDASGWLRQARPSPAALHAVMQVSLIVLATVIIIFLVDIYKNRIKELNQKSIDLADHMHALEVSQAELHRAQAVANVGSWTYDIVTDTMLLSAETCRIFALPEGTTGSRQTYLARTHAQDRSAAEATWQAALKSGALDYEHRIMVGKAVRWVRQKAEFEFAADGSAISAVGITQDITERRKADEQMSVAAATFELQDAVMITDAKGVILSVNSAFTRSTGYSVNELVGRSARRLKSTHHDAAFYHSMWTTIQRTGTWQGEIWDQRKNGELYPKWLTISTVKDCDGAVCHYIGTHHDMTERKNAEFAVLKLNRELGESRQQLRQLVAQQQVQREAERKHIAREVHDELGQLMTALRLDMSLMAIRYGALDAALITQVNASKALVDRAIAAVRQVAANLRPVELDLGLVSAIEFLCHEFGKHNATVCVLRIADKNISLDEARSTVIFRILQESLTNVARYAGAGQVTVTLGCDDDKLSLEIRDNGRGFDMAAVANRHSLGLLGMRERAIALSGRLDVISAPGQGTVVSVTIPLNLHADRSNS